MASTQGDGAAGTGAGSIPDGIEVQGLRRFLAEHVPGSEGPLTIEMISGGRSNLTYTVRAPGGEWILRRPPLGHVLPTAHDMAREFHVLQALHGSSVPVPKPIALCDDPSVLGAPFYLMERISGVVVRDRWPEGYETSAGAVADRERLSDALVTMLARLHGLDWNALGLAGLGRPAGYLERQVRRWREQWERSKTRELPAVDELTRRLSAALPASPAPAIVHGDFRLDNVILAADDPARILAVLDWEMCTIGDPLADLGLLLAYWTQADDPPERRTVVSQAGNVMCLPGFWRREQVAEAYARLTGTPLDTLDFYVVLAFYKLAIVVEGIYARYLAGKTRGAGFERYGERVPVLAELGLEVAARSEMRALRG